MPRCAISIIRRAITSRSARIGGPGALASRPKEPLPGRIKGRREYRNSFGIKHDLGLCNGLGVIRCMNGRGPSNEVAIVATDKETIWIHVREPVATPAN